MRHSTGKPTKAEKARMDAIKEADRCIACTLHCAPTMPGVEIHHLLSGNRRRGHMFTVGLCPWHHRSVVHPYFETSARMRERYGPSLANGSKPFREAFGDDEALLEYQNRLLDGH